MKLLLNRLLDANSRTNVFYFHLFSFSDFRYAFIHSPTLISHVET